MPQHNTPQLRFPEFSGAWEEKKLGDIYGKISSGKSIKNIEDGKFLFYGSTGMIGNSNNYDYEGNKILIARVGANAGNIYNVEGKYNVSDNTLIVNEINDSNLNFTFNLLTSFGLNKLIFGSGQPLITGGQVSNLLLKFPTSPEQQKIASFLSAADKKIEQLQQKKALLEQYKKGMMQKLFSQQVRFKDDNGKEFPEWEEKELADFLIPTLREMEKPKTKYLAIGVRSHCKGTFQKPDSEPHKIAMDKLYIVKAGDLIVNITFAWESAIAIVKEEDEGGLVSHRFPTYIFNEKRVLGKFFQYVFIQKRFKQQLDLISPGGAGRNRVLSKKDFLLIKWELPSVKEQNKIADFLMAIDAKINAISAQLDKAKSFKKGLLQQMFV